MGLGSIGEEVDGDGGCLLVEVDVIRGEGCDL